MNACVTFFISACMILCQLIHRHRYTYYSTPDLPGNILTLDDIDLLLEKLLDVRIQWYHLGLQLKVRVEILDWIRKQFSDPRDQLRVMLKDWLTTDNPSWNTLTDALRSRNVGESQLADVLEANYCLMKDMRESKH